MENLRWIKFINNENIPRKSILEKYNEFLEDNKNILDHIRVTIREDEDFGEGIVELKNGTPSSVSYSKETGEWE